MTKPVMVQLVQRFAVGGLETMALTLGEQLQSRFEVHYLSLEGDRESLIEQWPRLGRLEHFRAFGKGPGVDSALVKRLRAYLRQHKVACLHSHHLGPLLYGGAAALGLELTHMHTHHDGWSLELGRQKPLTRWAQALFRPRTVADALTVAEAFDRAGCPVDRVIANGVAAHKFLPGDQRAARRRFGLPARALLVGTACRLEPVKGVDRLISLLDALPQEVHLVVAGEGSQRSALESLAEGAGVADRCHFLGQVEQMERWYPALDLFCLASHSEGAPMSLLEAQACEVPVLATDVGNCRNMICTEMSHIVNPEAPLSWLKPIRRLLSLSGGHRGALRRYVLAHGSDTRMADQYLELLEECP